MISETPPAVVHQTPRRYLMVLLPQSFASPQALIWVLAVPQFVLLGLNVRAGWLAWGEMGELQQKQAVFLGCGEKMEGPVGVERRDNSFWKAGLTGGAEGPVNPQHD
jgi:hypothetical protein